MQQMGSSDEELQVAVSKLAAQVEDLTAMVAQLAGEPAGGAGGAKGINGAVVDAGAAVPVVSTTSKGKSESKPPLVRCVPVHFRRMFVHVVRGCYPLPQKAGGSL